MFAGADNILYLDIGLQEIPKAVSGILNESNFKTSNTVMRKGFLFVRTKVF
jgi:hypothetical protein